MFKVEVDVLVLLVSFLKVFLQVMGGVRDIVLISPIAMV
jgi:hypothetical protein